MPADNPVAVQYLPNVPGDPVPSAGRLLNSPTLQNMPLWPGFVSYLERLLDPQHSQRVVKLGGDDMIYGPTLDIFQQQQKLRMQKLQKRMRRR